MYMINGDIAVPLEVCVSVTSDDDNHSSLFFRWCIFEPLIKPCTHQQRLYANQMLPRDLKTVAESVNLFERLEGGEVRSFR
jgi:hypothetical protein